MEHMNFFVRTSRQFCGIIIRRGEKKVRSERGRGGRTRVIFKKARGRDNQGGHISTPVINLHQGDPMPGIYGNLYRHTECFACHSYRNFADQFSYK